LALNSNTSFKLSSDRQEYSIQVFKIIIQKRRYRYSCLWIPKSRGTPLQIWNTKKPEQTFVLWRVSELMLS